MSAMDSFTALADPTRRRILEMLSKGSLSSGEIAARFKVSAPAVSQHLQALLKARLVRVQARAQRRIYELDREGVEEVSEWVGRIRLFWGRRLDTLEELLKKESPP
jgi:DNA-binding transcriptional ArsR family regulator